MQADSLYAAGISAYGRKDYDAAIRLFLKCDSLNKASERPLPYYSSNAAAWAGSSYYKTGNGQKAKELDDRYCHLAPVDQRLTVASDSLSYLAEQYAGKEEWDNALRCMEQCAQTEKEILGENHYYYANSLNYIAYLHSNLQHYAAAAEYGTRALNIQKRLLGETHPDCITLSNKLAGYYFFLGDYDRAIEFGVQVLNTTKEVLGEQHPLHVTVLGNLACYYFARGDYDKAIALNTQALEIRKQTLGEMHPDYATALGDLADWYSSLGNYKKAIELETQALEIRKQALGEMHPDYALSLNNLAGYYSELGDYDRAIELGTQALEIQRQTLGEMHPSCATSLGNLADYYSSLGDYDRATELGLQALEIRKQALGEKHPVYAITLNNLAGYYSELGDYDRAIELETQALKIQQQTLGEMHPDYALSLSNLAYCYLSLGDYDTAIGLGTQALEIQQQTLGEMHPDCVISLSNLAGYYSSLGDYDKAIALGTRALDIRKQTLGGMHPDYATSLDNLAGYYSALGDYDRAIELGTQALNLRKQTLGEKHPDYALSLNNLAYCYALLGDYDRAIKLDTQSLEIQRQTLGEKHPSYATSLGNLADFYSSAGNYDRAIALGAQALEIREQTLGEQHPACAVSLNNLASYYSSVGDYDRAIALGTQALEIQRRTLGGMHPDRATVLANLAYCYLSLGDYNKAIEAETLALNIRKQTLGEMHPDYATALGNLAGCYFNLGNYDRATEYLSDCIGITCRNIVRNFRSLGSLQRNKYWDMNRMLFDYANLCCLNAPDNALLHETVYNAVLFSKGILLASEIEFDNVIKESGDTVLLRQFEEMRMVRLQLEHYYKQPIAERKAETVTRLEARAGTLEQALIKGCKEYGDFTRHLNIKWTDVQAALGERDVAIEFAAPESDSLKRHIALVLRKGWDAPRYVYIGSANDFAPYRSQGDALYTSQELSDMIWSRILETAQVQEGENIYFSPDGICYQIAIEYLPTDDGGIMSEKYNIERLSSTKELCLREQSAKSSSAVLYGGLQYDLDSNVIAAESRKYTRSSELRGDDFFKRFISDKNADSLARNTISYLPGTLAEVKNISSTLENNGIECQTFTAAGGNEESFKALSGHTPKIIHIATHGFYLPITQAELLSRQRQVAFLAMGNEQKANIIDYSMSRTGLLFAGAQTAWSGKPVPENADDGILTAKEISQLDLRNVDLAVLSACQTALGEITSDGVAGLQRGFKKAGVKTLVMSLWPVNDQATRIMMTAFYENLTSGQSKRDAFNHAILSLRDYETEIEIEIDDTDQQMIYDEVADDYVYPKKIIREKIKPYTNPKYWAAFVMLD